MSAITPQIYKKVIPESENDSNYEAFEFLLAWYSREGQLITKMFTDWEVNNNIGTSFINRADSQRLKNIIGSKENNRLIEAEDLTLNDLTVLSSIYEATKIIRIKKDGTTERIGLGSNRLNYRQTDGRYNLPIEIILFEEALAQ